jgi:hypothetical protein
MITMRLFEYALTQTVCIDEVIQLIRLYKHIIEVFGTETVYTIWAPNGERPFWKIIQNLWNRLDEHPKLSNDNRQMVLFMDFFLWLGQETINSKQDTILVGSMKNGVDLKDFINVILIRVDKGRYDYISEWIDVFGSMISFNYVTIDRFSCNMYPILSVIPREDQLLILRVRNDLI